MTFRFAALMPLLLAGCAPLPDLPDESVLHAAADPALLAPAPPGPWVPYQVRPIVAPADWRGLNETQRPGGGS